MTTENSNQSNYSEHLSPSPPENEFYNQQQDFTKNETSYGGLYEDVLQNSSKLVFCFK